MREGISSFLQGMGQMGKGVNLNSCTAWGQMGEGVSPMRQMYKGVSGFLHDMGKGISRFLQGMGQIAKRVKVYMKVLEIS